MVFQHSLVVIKNYKEGVNQISDDYRYYLHPIKELISQCTFNPYLIKELTNYIDPSISPSYVDEIYAIFPVYGPKINTSFVLYQNSWLIVELAPNQIVEEIIYRTHNLKYEFYIKAIQSFFKKKIRIIPIATSNYSLIPLGSNNDKETFWINPGRVKDIIKTQFESTVIFDNHFQLSVPRVEIRVQELMRRSFISHGILKRDFSYALIHPTTHLFNFLGVSSTEITRKILKGIVYDDIPGRFGEFLSRYEKAHSSSQWKLFLEQLDLEE